MAAGNLKQYTSMMSVYSKLSMEAMPEEAEEDVESQMQLALTLADLSPPAKSVVGENLLRTYLTCRLPSTS